MITLSPLFLNTQTRKTEDIGGIRAMVGKKSEPVEMVLEETKEKRPLPEVSTEHKAVPIAGKPENTVKIGNTIIEIKPTKLMYQRDRTAAFYKMIDLYPLPEVLAMTKDGIGDTDRDGDKCVFDWLIAATNDPQLIADNYDDMDTETVETILSIFKRVNKIIEKEENLKKFRQAKGEMA